MGATNALAVGTMNSRVRTWLGVLLLAAGSRMNISAPMNTVVPVMVRNKV